MKPWKDIYQYILAAIIILGFFAVVCLLIYVNVPVANQGPLNIILGGLISAFLIIIGFFFGSSKGSQAKDTLLANSIPSGDLTKQLTDISNDVKNQITEVTK